MLNYRNPYNIRVYLSKYLLELYKDGNLIKNYKIAIGKNDTPTPKGTFTIINKAVDPGGVYGAKWLGLSIPTYGIHGTNNPKSIGKAVSQGCIRMYNKDVIELFNLVPIGTEVKITE